MASGEGRVNLVHPEAVSGVECGAVRCELVPNGLLVGSVPAAAPSVTVRLRFVPRVFVQRGEAVESSASERLIVLRCPMALVSGEPLRNADELRVLVKLSSECVGDVHREALGAEFLAERAEFVEAGEHEAELAAEPPDEAGSQHLSAADAEAVQELTDRQGPARAGRGLPGRRGTGFRCLGELGHGRSAGVRVADPLRESEWHSHSECPPSVTVRPPGPCTRSQRG